MYECVFTPLIVKWVVNIVHVRTSTDVDHEHSQFGS